MHFLLSLILLTSFIFTAGAKEDTCIVRIEKLSGDLEKAKQYNLATKRAWRAGDYPNALVYSAKGLDLCKTNDFKKVEAKLLNNSGIASDYLGDYTSSLTNYFKALRIQEKLNDPAMEAYIMSNIGLIYSAQNRIDKGLSYHERSLKIRQKLNYLPDISASLNNIAIIYSQQGKYHRAIENYLECIRIDKEIGDEAGLGDDYNNIALCYLDLKEYDKSMSYLEMALEIRQRMNNPYGIVGTYTNIGTLYFHKKEYEKARAYFLLSIPLAKEIKSKDFLRYSYEFLSQVEGNLKDSAASFRYYKLFITYGDSLENIADTRAQAELELGYLFEKETEVNKLKQYEKDSQFRIILYSVSAGGLIILFFSMLLFRRWKQTQRQRQIIEEKNVLVQKKNDEILDSITYAKRIQTAILPAASFIDEILPEHFVLYLPKDIVAGDFYWLERHNKHLFLAVADCTGHGVPGALMSVVCHNALNRTTREFGLTVPGEILDKARQIIIEELSKSAETISDGMDISLCVLDEESNTLSWSGANNPLWIYRAATGSLDEWKADKQPIGSYSNHVPFTTHSIQVEPADRIYLFSDGYSDQFGGPRGKKMMSKVFKQLLLKNASLNLTDQKELLTAHFYDWKGELEQIDDVCVVCFSLTGV